MSWPFKKVLNLNIPIKMETDEESGDILDKMKRKNEKRLKRMKEIERDKQMFS